MTDDSTDVAETSDTGRSRHSRRQLLSMAAMSATAGAGLAGCVSGPLDGAGADDDSHATPAPGTLTATDRADIGRSLEDWPAYDPDWAAPTTSPLDADLETEVLVENLEIPWDLSFAPDGTLFLTERVGKVLQFDGDEVRTIAEPRGAIDAGSIEPGSDESTWWVAGGEGGTLGIAVHPSYPNPSHVFVYYTAEDDGEWVNTVEAFDVASDDPGTPIRTVVDGIPADNYHNGGRIRFGPRNYLWVTCGDGGEPENAQDRSSFSGKILRVTPEGDPAPDNPDPGGDADPRIFSLGHRNPQGIVWLPDGTPVCNEHGQTGQDEINRLEPGANYGWHDEDEQVREREEYPGSDVHRPLYNTGRHSFAPSGSTFYTGDAVPALRNRMITGGLISQQLVVTTLTPPGAALPPADDAYAQVTDDDWADGAYHATVHRLFRDEFGRVRNVEQGPDGDIYVITSNRDGRASEAFPREVDDVLVRIRQA